MIEPWVDLLLKPGLEHAQCKDKRTDACGHQHRPAETCRDVGKPALLLNRALIFAFIGVDDARGLASTENATQNRRTAGEPFDLHLRKREPRFIAGTIALCVSHRTLLLRGPILLSVGSHFHWCIVLNTPSKLIPVA